MYIFSDMLEWIEECSRLCHERCMCKMYLIDSFNPDQDDICETFLQQWKDGDQTMVNKFEGEVCQVDFFLVLFVF